jgi:hypothetical protein
MTITEPVKPGGSFSDFITQAPTSVKGAPTYPFTLELFANGSSIGWFGEDSGQWGIIVGRNAAAVSFVEYVYDGVLYLQNATDMSQFVSISTSPYYVGFSSWINAASWNGVQAQLSYLPNDGGHLYANRSPGFTPVTVQAHQVGRGGSGEA